MAQRSELSTTETQAKAVHEAALLLMLGITDYFFKEKRQINEIIFVPIAIMSRIIRTHDAIALLLKNEHYAEAAVLALTQ